MKVFDRLAELFESVLEYLERDTAEEYIRMWNEEIERISKKYDIKER